MQQSSNTNNLPIVYVDEVGRGCCMGPVVACAVFTENRSWRHSKLGDSKKMTESARDDVFAEMSARKSCGMLSYEIGSASPEEIDTFNILEATYLAMHRAIQPFIDRFHRLHIIVDGDRFKSPLNCTYECIPQGDAKVPGISMASVIAKVTRDRLICSNEYHGKFPEYNWSSNKGYVTKDHLEAIRIHGYTIHHRRSYDLKL